MSHASVVRDNMRMANLNSGRPVSGRPPGPVMPKLPMPDEADIPAPKSKPAGGRFKPAQGKSSAEKALESARGSGPKSAAEKRMERLRGVNPKKGD